jgi:hypothetical protein
MLTKFNLNLARLAQLILDVHAGSVSPTEVTEENLDIATYLSNPQLVALGSSVAMSTLGAAVWAAGSHAPSADSPEAHARGDFVLREHVNFIVGLVESTRLT